MVSVDDLNGPVRTVVDVMREKVFWPYFIAHRDVGMDSRGDFWLRREGEVGLLPGLKKKISFAGTRDIGLRLASDQTIKTDKVQNLTDPVDGTIWIKVQGTF